MDVTTVNRPYRHGRLRDALVEEALRLMAERRDAAFTLREVARRIGVSHSAAYRHFPSKDALLAEIARQGFALLTDALARSLDAKRPPEQVARLQARAYVRTALTRPAHFRCMFGPRAFADEEAASVDEACERSFACLTKAAARLTGSRAGSAAVHDAALAMWSIVHGLASLALDGQLGDWAPEAAVDDYERLADRAVTPLLRGLVRRSAR